MVTSLYLGIALTIFTMLLFLSRRPFTLEGKLISAFMFFLGLPMVIKLQLIGELNISFLEVLLCIKTCPFTYGPFLYLYTKLKVDPVLLFKYKYLLHFLPFILFTLILFPSHYTDLRLSKIIDVDTIRNELISDKETNRFQKQQLIHTSSSIPAAIKSPHTGIKSPYVSPRSKIIHSFLFSFILLSFFIYSFFILRLLSKHKKNISEYFSFDSIRINLKWLRWVTICFIISYLFVYFAQFLELSKYVSIIPPIPLLPDVGLLFFIFIFCFFAVRQPVIFPSTDRQETSRTNEIKKYANSRLRKEEEENYVNILERLMETEKPYLNENLTIADVSKMLGIPKHYLTQVINENFKRNFFMYINEYRVKKAKEMMTTNNYNDYTFLRIAYESGFNSKTVFNRIFKRITGYTPTEYRKLINKQV